jgi:regulator of CtrA degradation
MESEPATFKPRPRTEFVQGEGHVLSVRDRIVGRAYREAIELALQTRDYVRQRQQLDLRRADPTASIRVSGEALRVTARLTQVIAWLLTEKAASNGEISVDALSQPAHRLGGGPAVADAHIDSRDALPAELVDLLNRSWSMYDRVRRLDAAWRRGADDAAAA